MALPLSFGKAQASAVANTAEATFALANFNFDFSLYKVEAPTEYTGVGTSLSPFRKKEAESGRAHVTARKLGALFESLLPETPELARVYGLRASEVSESPAFGLSKSHHYGFFASRAGADATSIWASATSGPSTIRIHLLACMLARIWDGSEATSVWVEIVHERKQQLLDAIGATNSAAATMIAQQEISRTQLAEWDASARSWLRTADMAMKRQQKQLDLIISNVKAAVNTKPRLYDSVVDAWINALRVMECLVQGMPQQMKSGEILLGLSAWHIYPDMVVVDSHVTDIAQKDALVRQGGILTIGLHTSDSRQDAGVHWSLPLAHLRYYGDPVVTTRSITRDGSRLTLDELLIATLGAVIADWEVPSFEDGARWIIQLSNVIGQHIVSQAKEKADIPSMQESWLTRLAGAAQTYLDSEGIERQRCLQLTSLGKRCSGIFLGQSAKQFFGFSDFGAYFALLSDPEDRIEALRWAAEELGLSNHQSFIRYRHQYPEILSGKHCKQVFEYATVAKFSVSKDVSVIDEVGEGRNYLYGRWIYGGTFGTDHFSPDYEGKHVDGLENSMSYKDRLREISPVQTEQVVEAGLRKTKSKLLKRWKKSKLSKANLSDVGRSAVSVSSVGSYDEQESDRAEELDFKEVPEYTSLFTKKERSAITANFEQRRQAFLQTGESAAPLEQHAFSENLATGIVYALGVKDNRKVWDVYRLVIGDNTNVALYYKTGNVHAVDELRKHLPKVGYRRLQKLLGSEDQTSPGFLAGAADAIQSLGRSYSRTLRALASTAKLYKLLPEATISVRTLQCKIYEAAWVPRSDQAIARIDGSLDPAYRALRYLAPFKIDRRDAFACIAMHETGYFNLDPNTMTSVMALSTVDSLYVAAPLLCDPSETPVEYEVRRIMGNIGKAGVALLVPPVSPRIKSSEIDKWTLINHSEFYGNFTPRNLFKNTSLHLSFTGSSLPLDIGYSGKQDVEAYVLESLVSVHEGGSWIADLNVLSAVNRNLFQPLRPCNHQANAPPPEKKAISIENWTEFLERPQRYSVVQAHKNWQARLAATTISIMQEHGTMVVSDKFCWTCIRDTAAKLDFLQSGKSLTIIW